MRQHPSSSSSGSASSTALINDVGEELESLRVLPKHDGIEFPRSCRRLLLSLPGNDTCADCNSMRPEWASVTYGTLICLSCSGIHRSYGVSTSYVKSVYMDSWSHEHVLTMLEGGNDQVRGFFDRHDLGNGSHMARKRYHTKAARFYRQNLLRHVQKISNKGIYKGREVSRRRSCPGRTSSGNLIQYVRPNVTSASADNADNIPSTNHHRRHHNHPNHNHHQHQKDHHNHSNSNTDDDHSTESFEEQRTKSSIYAAAAAAGEAAAVACI